MRLPEFQIDLFADWQATILAEINELKKQGFLFESFKVWERKHKHLKNKSEAEKRY